MRTKPKKTCPHIQAQDEGEISSEWEIRRNRFYNVRRPKTTKHTSHSHRLCEQPVVKQRPDLCPYHQVGYKEGLDEGKALTIQHGFDEGASMSSLWLSCCPPGNGSEGCGMHAHVHRVQVRDRHGVPAGVDEGEGGGA